MRPNKVEPTRLRGSNPEVARLSTLGSLRLNAFLVLEDGPVKNVVVLEALPDEKIPEELSQVSVCKQACQSQSKEACAEILDES